MFNFFELLSFVFASIFLLLIPGPAVIYVIARSLEQGRGAGLASAAGTAAGGLIHVFAAVVGLTAILMTSSFLFSLVKAFGAGYLIYLGVMKLVEKAGPSQVGVRRRSLKKLFFDGAIIEAFNPKVAAFFISFLPQFVHSERGHVSIQVLVLGLIFCLLALLSDSIVALTADSLGKNFLKRNRKKQVFFNRITGGVYIALGIFAALFGSKSFAVTKP